MPDETDEPKPLVVTPPIDREAEDALEPDPMSDEIEKLEREAAPVPKRCPHCGKELPTE